MKDTLVITAKSSGAEVIPFIKVWAMFPGAILLTLLFTWLSNRFSREKVFYLMMSLFLGYFFVFAFFLYPMRDSLHPDAAADKLLQILPLGFKGFIAMFRNWTLTSFYVMSELWGNIILFVLCWGFANQVTKLNEAKRFYAIFGFGANSSGIVAGQISVFFSRWAFNENLPVGASSWEQSLIILVSLVVLSGVLALAIFYWLERHVLNQPEYYDPEKEMEDEKVKGKLSLLDNFAYLLKSKYLLFITVIVIAYNVIINLVEILWKDQLHALHPDPSAYNLYINQVSTIIGILATVAAILISGNSIRKYGWTFTALITPFVLLVTSIGFFGIYFFQDHLAGIALSLCGMTPLALIVFMGSAQNVLARGAKYTVFDATKEMAFVPLSVECKLKGKAAIDGVCNRFGKSGGSVIHGGLLIMFSSFAASAPYVAAILCLMIVVWIFAVTKLGKEFNAITASDRNEKIVPTLNTEEAVIV
jgi:AAA family ATP:ADP antiporter